MPDWTQAICLRCWNEKNPDRQAHKLLEVEQEICCYCGDTTKDGIYIRVDPRTVPYLQKEHK